MILDYIWKSLFLASVSGSLALAITLLASLALKTGTAAQKKWYFNLQIVVLMVLLGGSFLLAAIDHQMLAGCFDEFVKESASWSITRWISAAWVLSFIVLIVLDLARGYFAFRRVRALPPTSDRAWLARFEALKEKLGVRSTVELCVVSEGHSPFASGFFQHRVVVPRALAARTLDSVLAHELAHVRDRDSLFLALELLCRRLFFWNPLAYVFASVYAMSVETAADEAAVSSRAVSRTEFASSLLEVASLAIASSRSPVLVHASRGYRECKARLESLSHTPVRKSVWSMAVLALLAVAPIAISVAQARTINRESIFDPKMCVQAKHEQVIESWLRIEPAPPMKCEK